jgi:hypothetical protein
MADKVHHQVRLRREDAIRVETIARMWGKPKTEVLRIALDTMEQQRISPTVSRRQAALDLIQQQLNLLSEGLRIAVYARRDPAFPSEYHYTVTPWDLNNPEIPPWEIPPYPEHKAIFTKPQAQEVVRKGRFPWEEESVE